MTPFTDLWVYEGAFKWRLSWKRNSGVVMLLTDTGDAIAQVRAYTSIFSKGPPVVERTKRFKLSNSAPDAPTTLDGIRRLAQDWVEEVLKSEDVEAALLAVEET